MALFSNIYSTIKSAFQPAPKPEVLLTPEAIQRATVGSTTESPAAKRIAATAPAGTSSFQNITGIAPKPITPFTAPASFSNQPLTAPTSFSAQPFYSPQPEAPTPIQKGSAGGLASGVINAIGTAPDVLSKGVGYVPIAAPLQAGLKAGIPYLGDILGRGVGAVGAGVVGAATGLAYLATLGTPYSGSVKNLSKAAFKSIGPIWSGSEKERFNNDVANFKPESVSSAEDTSGAISGAQVAEDPLSGQKKVIIDRRTQGQFAGELNAGVAGAVVDNENRRAAVEQSLLEQQNANAIQAIADRLGMDASTVTELIGTDPGVRIFYDEAFKKAKEAKDSGVYDISDDNASRLTGGLPGNGNPPPAAGFNALEAFKAFMEASGVPEINKVILGLEEDSATVKNFYQQRHDEIKDNPEFPQWLKARRDEFVTKAEDRALALYENKLKALKGEKTNREKLAVDYYNASVKQYELDLQAKRDALDEFDTIADNDRQLVSDYMKYFADTGTNWGDLSFQQQENIRRQFNDPGAVEAFGTFNFKAAYDNQLALDWAAKNSSYKPTTTQIGDVVYEVTYDAGGKPSYVPLGRAGAPTAAQSRQDLLGWMAINSGKFTKEQLENAARSVNPELTSDDGVINAINSYAAKKEGGFLGFGGSYPTASQEDPLTSFSNYQNSKAFGGVGGSTGGGEVKVGDIVTYNGVQYRITGFDTDGTPVGDPI